MTFEKIIAIKCTIKRVDVRCLLRQEEAFIMSKAKYWLAVLYPENMRPDWKNEIGDLLGYPYAYCIHDKDKTKDGEARKTHAYDPGSLQYNYWKSCDEYF